MNAVVPLEDVPEESAKPKWQLQKLSPTHKQALALVAQGMKLVQVAPLVGITPEYLSLLLRQPIAKEYLQEMSEVVGTRLEALFEQSVEVIADTMRDGTPNEKLKAARLQLEATKRIGRGDTLAIIPQSPDERFARLADRLVGLLRSAKGETFNEDGTPTEGPEVLKYVSGRPSGQDSAAQALEHQRTSEPGALQDDSGQPEA